MFEIVISLCLAGQPDICRDQLVPTAVTQTLDQCVAMLDSVPANASLLVPPGTLVSDPVCQLSGPRLALNEVSEGVYVHEGRIEEASPDNRGDIANVGVVIGSNAIAVIDAGGSRAVGEGLYRTIRALSPLPISHLILTHMHPDHVLGASVFAGAGAEVIGHPDLKRALLDRRESYLTGFEALIGSQGFLGTGITLPGDEEMPAELDLGGRVLKLEAWPTAHSPTDLTVFDEMSGTLFAGDLVFDRHTPALDGSLMGWIAALADLETRPVRYLVPGHGGPVLRIPQGLMPLQRYLEALASDTRAALARGESLGVAVEHIARDQIGTWQLFDLFNTRNATVAYTELEWE